MRETENNQCPGKDKLKRKCLSFRRAPNSRLLSIITKRLDQGGTWYGRRPRRMPHCAMWGSSSPLPKKDKASPIFDPFLLWPNGWKHQDVTWYGRKPQPRGLCVRWGPSPFPIKGRSPGAEHPIFGPSLLWPNGWMDQDGTWHGDEPWSRPHCAR